MNIEPYLVGHAFMQVERPPLLWEIGAEEEHFDSAARDAGITFAYSRTVGEAGSVTVYFPLLSP
jgi:hypothetical protein